MREITASELSKILKEHNEWIVTDEKEGKSGDLNNANLWGAYLKGADLSGADLSDANLSYAGLKEAKDLTIKQLSKVKTLYKVELDPDLMEQVEKECHHLITLRSSYKTLSVSDVQSMPNVSIRKKYEWGFYGYSTINHDYNLKTIRGDKVVVDKATGLMWYQSGSDDYMRYKNAKKWLKKLNKRGYAGYRDWGLPHCWNQARRIETYT